MSRIVDNLIAYRVLSMLVKPFDETDAYKFGIIDKKGKNLRPANTLKTEEEKDSYDYLSRLVFNMKKLLNKLPGGDTKFKNIVAALFLIKEQWNSKTDIEEINENELHRILGLNVILVEETIQYKMFMEEGEGGALSGQGQTAYATNPPTNVSMPKDTPSNVSTDVPIKKKKTTIVRRQSMKPIAVDLNQKAL
jgi:hypothetical protein